MFVALGVLNLLGYGCSLMMTKKDFKNRFAHKGDGHWTGPLKSWCASDRLLNVMINAPMLIGSGLYMSRKLPALTSLKFFGMAFMMNYGLQVAFGPTTMFNKMNIRSFVPGPAFSCMDDEDKSQCGADAMAHTAVAMCLMVNGMWMPCAALMTFDCFYFGPSAVCR